VGGSAGHPLLWALNVAEGVYDGQTERQWELRSPMQRRPGKQLRRPRIGRVGKKKQLDDDRRAIVQIMGKLNIMENQKTASGIWRASDMPVLTERGVP